MPESAGSRPKLQPKKYKRIVATVTNDLMTDQRMQRICSSLMDWADEVVLVGVDNKASRPLPAFSFQTARLSVAAAKGFLFFASYNLRLFFFLLKQPKGTLLWSVDLDTLLAGVLAAKLKCFRCVYDAHEYYVESPEIVDRPLIKWFWRVVARLTIPFADAYVTVGPALAQIMSKRYRVDFQVIRNVPFKKIPAAVVKELPEKPILLYQGALNLGRGLPQLIEAMHQLPNCVLQIAGAGDIEAELKANALPFGDRIMFLGRLDPQTLAKVTDDATIGLNLLEHLGESYYYSLANKAFDYAQSGLPAVHMDFPEYQVFSQAAVLIKNLEPDTIARAIQTLLNPKNYHAASRAALLIGQTNHWENEKEILAQVLSAKEQRRKDAKN
jgi:glycosyltransferase involved in cell wall biosynthesis